jgi:hypothetical protein
VLYAVTGSFVDSLLLCFCNARNSKNVLNKEATSGERKLGVSISYPRHGAADKLKLWTMPGGATHRPGLW